MKEKCVFQFPYSENLEPLTVPGSGFKISPQILNQNA